MTQFLSFGLCLRHNGPDYNCINTGVFILFAVTLQISFTGLICDSNIMYSLFPLQHQMLHFEKKGPTPKKKRMIWLFSHIQYQHVSKETKTEAEIRFVPKIAQIFQKTFSSSTGNSRSSREMK